jgi:hypothetical protein
MRIKRQRIIQAADWLLPPNIFRAVALYRPSALWFALTHCDVLTSNRHLHDRHAGARCFILCNGPSVKEQNILPLKEEIVFSVSNGYLHSDYGAVAPHYHCVPQITYSDTITPQVVIDWFNEMHAKLGHAELVLSHQECQLVQEHGLFQGRTVHYLCMGKHYFPNAHKARFDLAGILPRAQSAPIMALMIALAMGFKEIYLLGTDHDWFVKKEYVYAFEPGIMKDKDNAVGKNGAIESSLLDDLPMIEKLWSQYRGIRHMAERSGVKIFNATHGGILDEFPRVRLEDVVKS